MTSPPDAARDRSAAAGDGSRNPWRASESWGTLLFVSVSSPTGKGTKGTMPRLRIISVNDVYSLENLPRLRSLVRHYAELEPRVTLVVALAGDFLAPSLLSSIDGGRGMVDCLNAVGVTHVILGNHEDDLPEDELWARLRELAAVCLGTNVRSRAGADLPRHDVIDVTDRISVGLVGVVMADAAVYRGKPFGGVDLARANDAAMEECALLARAGCSTIVALTHQSIADDRALARVQREPPLSAIIGGHEHIPLLEEIEGTWIVKAGSEAAHAVVTEIAWPNAEAPASWTVTTRLEDVAPYPEDPAVRARVDRHMAAVRELSRATLLYLQPGAPLSSVGTRSRQTSVGTLICSRLRDALAAEVCLFNGGGIRAAREYSERLTYGDVEAEVPFDNEVVVVKMKGRVVRDAIAASRANAPAESGAFLQVDDRVQVLGPLHTVVSIDGSPLDLEREYDVAIVRELLLGLDHVEPLVRWAAENPTLVPPPGSGREPKVVLVQAFAVAIWRELGGFDAIDTDRDDRVTSAEIAAAVTRAHPSQAPASVLADLVVRAVDADADRVVSRDDASLLGGVLRRR
jgi:2',3'-cyclic-nucleotide 2'-phosphodiesterase (5'-nucleotidase family)